MRRTRNSLIKSFAFQNSNKDSWKTAKLEYWDNNQNGKLDEIRLSFEYDPKTQKIEIISLHDSDDNGSLETLVLTEEWTDTTKIVLTGVDDNADDLFDKTRMYHHTTPTGCLPEKAVNPGYYLLKAKAQLGSFVLRVQKDLLNVDKKM